MSLKIYLTFRNADMNEGRGPMIPSLAFAHKHHAEQYIDDQPGVMGRRYRWSTEDGGDWEVREIEVLQHSVVDAEKARQALVKSALMKLTPQEKEALGWRETS